MADPDPSTLQAVEAAAQEIAAAGGALLLNRFRSRLAVRYKDEHDSDPVTDLDHAVEDLIRREVQSRFPTHALLGEEQGESGPSRADYVWVVDPLDGTSNFVNGLPLFACSIGVLWRGAPVVGALYLPTSAQLQQGVYHARRGGGMHFNGQSVAFTPLAGPTAARLSAIPGGTAGVDGPRGHRFGVTRTLGSIAAELAFTAEGTLQMGLFEGARIWDVAGGVALCLEAGAGVYERPPRARRWRRFERFAGDGVTPPSVAALRAWNTALSVGNAAVLPALAAELQGEQRPLAVLRRLLLRGH